MDVLTESDAPVLLSNAEVLELLKGNLEERKKTAKKKKKINKLAHRDWIEEQVCNYLTTTPGCVATSSPPNTHLTEKQRSALQSQLLARKQQKTTNGDKVTKGFHLTQAEALQLLNFLPRELVEIHLMIEELHARMSDGKQEELLALIQEYVQMAAGGESKDTTMNGHEAAVNGEGPVAMEEVEEDDFENEQGEGQGVIVKEEI